MKTYIDDHSINRNKLYILINIWNISELLVIAQWGFQTTWSTISFPENYVAWKIFIGIDFHILTQYKPIIGRIVCLHWRHGIPLTPLAGAMLGGKLSPTLTWFYCAGSQDKMSPLDQFICNFFQLGFLTQIMMTQNLASSFYSIWSLETHLNKTAALIIFVIIKVNSEVWHGLPSLLCCMLLFV